MTNTENIIPERIELPVPRPDKTGFDSLFILPDFYLDLCRAVLRVMAIRNKAEQHRERLVLYSLIKYGAHLFAGPRDLALTNDDIYRLVGTLAVIERMADIEKWMDEKDAVMSICYHIVQQKVADHSGVKSFAEKLLNTKYTSKEAFAKTLLRWATAPQRRLDPLPRGRPTKKQTPK